jgi:hypothetical protein
MHHCNHGSLSAVINNAVIGQFLFWHAGIIGYEFHVCIHVSIIDVLFRMMSGVRCDVGGARCFEAVASRTGAL